MCFRACLPISPFIEILLNFLPALYYKMILAAYYFYVIHFLFYWHLHLSMKILPLWTAAYNLRSYQTGWIQNNMANITNFWCFPYSWLWFLFSSRRDQRVSTPKILDFYCCKNSKAKQKLKLKNEKIQEPNERSEWRCLNLVPVNGFDFYLDITDLTLKSKP